MLVFLQGLAGAIWMLIDSSQAELLEGISSELLGNIDTVGEWLLLAAATGIGEELLFRGAIQPIFGIGVTSFLFATAHVQYGITPVTFIVFVIGIILGLIRRKYNTTTSIFVHSGYNFVLGMLSLIALQLEQMIGCVKLAQGVGFCYNAAAFGAWRSLVARFNGVEEVVGSNPAAPTSKKTPLQLLMRRFCFLMRRTI